MNIRTVYGIHDVPDIIFLSLDAAEEYVCTENPGNCWSKDSLIDYCHRQIWEEDIKTCEGCGTKVIYSEMDEYWTKPRCCDLWYCHEDCHG
jgi:hypothetical protein